MDINLFIAIATLIVAAVTFFATIVIGKKTNKTEFQNGRSEQKN